MSRRVSGRASWSTVPRALGHTFRAFHLRNYRLFWLGQLVSVSGTWIQRVGQAWLVLQLTDSPLALGTVTALQFAPVTVLSLIGGIYADRWPKRRLLVITQSLMALQALVLAILASNGLVELWHVYALAALLGLANAFDNPTRQAFIAELVGPRDLPNAVALNSSQFNSARIVGPAIGGLVVATAGVAACFWLNTASYLGVIGALLAIRSTDLFEVPAPSRGPLLRQLREGLGYALRTREVCLILIVLAAVGLFGFNFNIFLPLLAHYALDSGALGFGILMSSLGAGSLMAALVLASRREATERRLLQGAALLALLLLLVALSPWYAVTAILLVGLGAASTVFSATANARLQLNTPPELRGRVMSLYSFFFLGSAPLGATFIGSLSEQVGIRLTVAICAGACWLGVFAGLVYRRRKRSQSDNQATARAGAPSLPTR